PVFQFSAVPPIPQIGLIDTIPSLPHIDWFQPSFERMQLPTPPLFLADAVPERIGITDAHDADLSGRLNRRKIPIVSKPLRIDDDVDAGAEDVLHRGIWNIAPSKLGVVSD